MIASKGPYLSAMARIAGFRSTTVARLPCEAPCPKKSKATAVMPSSWSPAAKAAMLDDQALEPVHEQDAALTVAPAVHGQFLAVHLGVLDGKLLVRRPLGGPDRCARPGGDEHRERESARQARRHIGQPVQPLPDVLKCGHIVPFFTVLVQLTWRASPRQKPSRSSRRRILPLALRGSLSR